MSVNVRVDGLMVLAGLAVAGAGYAYFKRKDIANAVNPASSENLVYKGLGGGTGGALDTTANHVFGAVDLINPWAPDYRKVYARKVWGLTE